MDIPAIDILVVGAGPAGLAAALRAKQRAPDRTVVVIDKAPSPGAHALSGAAFEPAVLDALVPDWRELRTPFTTGVVPVEQDELWFLRETAAYRVPARLVPSRMHHAGDVIVSASRLVAFLAERAEAAGVELHHGFAADDLLVEDGRVVGVRLGAVGQDADGNPQPNYRAPEPVRAAVTIIADGSHGVLSTRFTERFGRGEPQVYSVGIKALIRFAGDSPFGTGRVVHTLGYPLTPSMFGGGFLYSMGPQTVTAGLILGLDWAYRDVNPVAEFERFRAHPAIAALLEGGTVVATGAKTIPEGGYRSIGTLSVDGALVAGDAAGLVNMEKIKGIHYAMRGGIAAADTAVEGLANGLAPGALHGYRSRLEADGVLADLRHARNYRQSFARGIVLGAPLSLVSSLLPRTFSLGRDGRATRRDRALRRPDPGGLDQATFVALTGTVHREHEPSHITVDTAACAHCLDEYGAPCTTFCPGQVYRLADDGGVRLSPSNCLHCMTCTVKCPLDAVDWRPPEGGEGPRYKQL
jgi:electron-transferring-flavoprotein dehydrogenase